MFIVKSDGEYQEANYADFCNDITKENHNEYYMTKIRAAYHNPVYTLYFKGYLETVTFRF